MAAFVKAAGLKHEHFVRRVYHLFIPPEALPLLCPLMLLLLLLLLLCFLCTAVALYEVLYT